jgi:hypothetical protein
LASILKSSSGYQKMMVLPTLFFFSERMAEVLRCLVEVS